MKYSCINFSKTNLKETKKVNSKLQIALFNAWFFLLKPNNYGYAWPCYSLNFQGQGAQHPLSSTKSLGGSSSTEKRTVSSVKTKAINKDKVHLQTAKAFPEIQFVSAKAVTENQFVSAKAVTEIHVVSASFP